MLIVFDPFSQINGLNQFKIKNNLKTRKAALTLSNEERKVKKDSKKKGKKERMREKAKKNSAMRR